MTHTPSQLHPKPAGPHVRAFTLVELMISIAMVLILLVGVNQVFKMSADTVGSGMAVSEAMRSLRAVRATLTNDLTQMTSPSAAPFLIIHNQLQPAFLNKQDQAANTVAVPAPNANEKLVPDRHAHRMDILQFFVSGGDYRRQSGTMGGTQIAFQGDLTAEDAWVWIGHLRVSHNGQDVTGTANYPMPAAGTIAANANNFNANQWILGRQRILMSQKDSTGTVRDSSLNRQWYSDVTLPVPTSPNPPTLQPLAWNSRVNSVANTQVSVGGSQAFIQSSFTDVAGMSLGTYRGNVLTAFTASPANAARQMLYQSTSPTLPFGVYRFAAKPWLDKSIKYAGSTTTVGVAQANLLQFETALEAPILLRGCTQFIVEYAGDYMQQDPTTGNWLADGANPTAPELDWNPVFKGSTVVGRSVRWYGLHRAANVPVGTATAVPDVLPVYWYLTNHTLTTNHNAAPVATGTKAPVTLKTASFERMDLLSTAAATANNVAYDCAWSPNDLAPPVPVSGSSNTVSKSPWLIRITIRVDDANNRLPDGQTMEFIYELPHAK